MCNILTTCDGKLLRYVTHKDVLMLIQTSIFQHNVIIQQKSV